MTAWSYARGAAGLTSGVMFALILASSPAGAVDSERDVLRRESAAMQAQRVPPAVDRAPPAANRWYGGASVAGGLLLGAAVAFTGSRRRASAPTRA